MSRGNDGRGFFVEHRRVTLRFSERRAAAVPRQFYVLVPAQLGVFGLGDADT